MDVNLDGKMNLNLPGSDPWGCRDRCEEGLSERMSRKKQGRPQKWPLLSSEDPDPAILKTNSFEYDLHRTI